MTSLFGFTHRPANLGWGLFFFLISVVAAADDFIYDDDVVSGFAAICFALTGLLLFLDGLLARKGQRPARGLLDMAGWLLLLGLLVILFFG